MPAPLTEGLDQGRMAEPAGPPATGPAGLAGGEWVWLAALVVVGLLLRLHHLGDGLWYDEIETLVEHVRLPLGELLTTYQSKNQHPLFSLLAHLSIGAFGESAWALRLPAALLGALSPAAVYLLGRLVASRAEAFTAAALLAVSSHHIWFSQNARGYTGLLFWATLATLAFLRLLRDPRAGRGMVALYALATAFALYTHLTAAFQLAAHGLVWLFAFRGAPDRGRRAFLALVLGGVGGALLYAPVLPKLAPILLSSAAPAPAAAPPPTEWKSPFWLLREMMSVLARGLPGGYLGLAVVAGIGLAGLVRFFREERLALALFVLPGVVTAAAIVALHHNLWPRFFFFLAGFVLLIGVRGWFTVAGLAGRRARAVAIAGAAAGVLLLAATAPRAWGHKQQYQAAVAFVEQAMGPGDRAATVDLTNYPVHQWLGRDWPIIEQEHDLAELEARSARTWVLTTFPIRLVAEAPGVVKRLGERYDTVQVFRGTISGGDIVVLGSRPAPAPGTGEVR
jgi:mannosyltransferase